VLRAFSGRFLCSGTSPPPPSSLCVIHSRNYYRHYSYTMLPSPLKVKPKTFHTIMASLDQGGTRPSRRAGTALQAVLARFSPEGVPRQDRQVIFPARFLAPFHLSGRANLHSTRRPSCLIRPNQSTFISLHRYCAAMRLNHPSPSRYCQTGDTHTLPKNCGRLHSPDQHSSDPDFSTPTTTRANRVLSCLIVLFSRIIFKRPITAGQVNEPACSPAAKDDRDEFF